MSAWVCVSLLLLSPFLCLPQAMRGDTGCPLRPGCLLQGQRALWGEIQEYIYIVYISNRKAASISILSAFIAWPVSIRGMYVDMHI